MAIAVQSQVDLESTFKVSKDDTANNLIQLKQETEDLIKNLKKIKDNQQLKHQRTLFEMLNSSSI